MRWSPLEHRFVTHFPDHLEPGVLYVSMEYGSIAHSCCCGCGQEVVTPLSPTDWKMTYDGETISLWPSIGNWSLPCRSHYVIERGRAIKAAPWTDQQIAAGRREDRVAKALYYSIHDSTAIEAAPSPTAISGAKSVFSRLKHWFLKWVNEERP